jgi:hypothetical protein
MELIIRFVQAGVLESDPSVKIGSVIIERNEGESAGAFTERIIETARR